VPAHVMEVIEEELGKLSFLDPHSSEFKYELSLVLSLPKAETPLTLICCTTSCTTNPRQIKSKSTAGCTTSPYQIESLLQIYNGFTVRDVITACCATCCPSIPQIKVVEQVLNSLCDYDVYSKLGLYRIADFTIRLNKNNSFYYSAEYE